MPRYNVEYYGKWACFSSIVDAFVTKFADKESYEVWRRLEYGRGKPAEECNMMTMEEAVSCIKLNRTREETLMVLLGAGVGEGEAVALIDRSKGGIGIDKKTIGL